MILIFNFENGYGGVETFSDEVVFRDDDFFFKVYSNTPISELIEEGLIFNVRTYVDIKA